MLLAVLNQVPVPAKTKTKTKNQAKQQASTLGEHTSTMRNYSK